MKYAIFIVLAVMFFSKPVGRLSLAEYRYAIANCTVEVDNKDFTIFFCKEGK